MQHKHHNTLQIVKSCAHSTSTRPINRMRQHSEQAGQTSMSVAAGMAKGNALSFSSVACHICERKASKQITRTPPSAVLQCSSHHHSALVLQFLDRHSSRETKTSGPAVFEQRPFHKGHKCQPSELSRRPGTDPDRRVKEPMP